MLWSENNWDLQRMCLTLVTDGHLTGISCSIGVCIECCQTHASNSRPSQAKLKTSRLLLWMFWIHIFICIMKLCTLAHPLEENLKWICLTLNLLGDPLWPVGTIWTSTLLSLLNGWKKKRVEKSQKNTWNRENHHWWWHHQLLAMVSLKPIFGTTKIVTISDCQSLTKLCSQVWSSRLTSDSSGSLGAMLHWNDKKRIALASIYTLIKWP